MITFVDEWTIAGAAVMLGAERVAGWSAAERDLARGVTSRPHGEAIGQIRALIQAGADPLGEAFSRVRSPARRRASGQTFTPRPVVDSMIGWAGRMVAPARVVDPGAGSARFLVAAGRRWPAATLTGVECDPLAALTARATLAAAGMADRATILLADYRSVRLPPATGPTLFIGNPPYVRHHQIPQPWKQWLRSTAHSAGLAASGLAGLHAHFFLATALHAAPGDAGVLVTAAEWLDVNYGGLIRSLLLGSLGVRGMHLLDPGVPAFADAAVTSVITCFLPGTRPSAVRVRRVGRIEDLGDLSDGVLRPAADLRRADRWSALVASPATPSPLGAVSPRRSPPARVAGRRPRPPAGFTELGELCGVHRGQVTGANNVWITAAGDPSVPAACLFASITRASELFQAGETLASVTGLRCVVDLPADLGELSLAGRALASGFLARARAAGAADSYVAAHRTPWWRVRLSEPAPILATYMARRPPTFVRNLAGARHVNIAHGLYPRGPLTLSALDGLAAYLRASVTLAQGRTYSGGLVKFEPGEMERIPVPVPDLLPGYAGGSAAVPGSGDSPGSTAVPASAAVPERAAAVTPAASGASGL